MYILITGLGMWVVIHLFPSVGWNARTNIINNTGLVLYKGIFALLIVTSVVFIVFGWRSTIPEPVYLPPEWGSPVAFVLVLLTFILFAAARRKTNIKRILRHPQLTGLLLWSIGHLLANGDQRSLILFTTLGLWALLEMRLISIREGHWEKPDTVSKENDVITVILGCVLYVVLLFAHPYLAGITLL